MQGFSAQKICLITGATSGIGRAAAQGIATLGFTTVVVGRARKKCDRVCRQLIAQTGNPNIKYMLADLSVQGDIHRLADQFQDRFDRLDILINNAGAKFLTRMTTVDGIEMTFGLNHLSYFLFTRRLIGCLKDTGNARIINVSSGSHIGAKIDFDDLQNENKYIGQEAYIQSKLANLLFTYELARRLQGTGITVNAMAPGAVFTNYSRNNGWISWAKHVTYHVLAGNLIGPRKAAETILYLATSTDVAGITGKYFFEMQPTVSSPASYDEADAQRLWEISKKLTCKTPLS